jgi:hypothetical protein
VDIDPGQSVVVTATGTIQDSKIQTISMYVQVWADSTKPALTANAYAYVIAGRGSVDGTLYFDANGNGRYDQGEGLAGVKIKISGGAPYQDVPPQTTDRDGHFAFTDVPFGSYYAQYDGLGDLVAGVADWTVSDQAKTLLVEARHKIADSLKASVGLDATTYAPGDTAKITVTLTNSGDHALSGITEICNGVGDPNELNGYGDGWGNLPRGKAGVTVPAHSTLTVDATEKVPAEAHDWGFTGLECAFGQSDFDSVFTNYAVASVPGAVVPTAVLSLGYDKNDDGHPLPVTGVKVYLTDDVTKKIVASAVTDSAGNATFASLPAGLYEIGLVGPWQVAGDKGQGTTWPSIRALHGPTAVAVEPGPDQPDPTATTPTTEVPVSPVAEASPTPELAYTGVADVVTLTVVALGALVAGIGLMVLSRRHHGAKS